MRRFRCTQSGGFADLTNGASGKFLMVADPGYDLTFTPVSEAVTFEDRAGGIVGWAPSPAAVGTVGHFRAEVQITFGDGSKRTFPEEDWLPVEVVQDLGD